MVYDVIDYDGTEDVDFVKFCMMNTDKSNDIFRIVEELKETKKNAEKKN